MNRECLKVIVSETRGSERKAAREKLLLAMGAKGRRGKALTVAEMVEKKARERDAAMREKNEESRFKVGMERASKKRKKKLVKKKGGLGRTQNGKVAKQKKNSVK